MGDTVLTRERILEVAEDVLRRFGPEKATVVDVARALGVSHGSVYRHFPSKVALRDAVTERWLNRMFVPLERVVQQTDEPAPQRLRRWFDVLIAAKHGSALDDPELFATYHELALESREVVKAHMDALVAQITRIIEDGVARGEFTTVDDPRVAARAVFDVTTRFHNPAHVAQWSDPNVDAAFEAVWTLLMRGLGANPS